MPDPLAGLQVPKVAIGFATKLGVIVGALATLIAAALVLANGDHSTEALGAFITAAAAFYAVVTGRSNQAAANTQAVAAIASAEAQASPLQRITGGSVMYGGTEPPMASSARITLDPEGPPPPASEDEDDDGGEQIAEEEGVAEHEPDDPDRIPIDVGDADAVERIGGQDPEEGK